MISWILERLGFYKTVTVEPESLTAVSIGDEYDNNCKWIKPLNENSLEFIRFKIINLSADGLTAMCEHDRFQYPIYKGLKITVEKNVDNILSHYKRIK